MSWGKKKKKKKKPFTASGLCQSAFSFSFLCRSGVCVKESTAVFSLSKFRSALKQNSILAF